MKKINNEFERDVVNGLNSKPKYLLSKYFYDDAGSRIFQEIMRMEDYYLPDCETEILQLQSPNIVIQLPFDDLEVIELGAGDGSKTIHLLEELLKSGKKITYIPMDISEDILKVNKKTIRERFPDLEIAPLPGDYFHTLGQIKNSSRPKLVLFMGSNIGNFKGNKAIEFIQYVNGHLNESDFFLLGVDLKKHPQTILAAYNDAGGITKRFNLNLLKRINRELNGNFNTNAFDHYSTYNPISGTATSYLISLENQQVNLNGYEFEFHINEAIHMEISQKYSLEDLDQLAAKTGFPRDMHFTDSKGYFSVSLFQK